MVLEVIATCIDDVHRIAEGCGDRIELVSALTEGGVTPSRGLIAEAVRCAAPIPVMVMIRPHARTFVYSQEDLKIMRDDLNTALDCGAAGIVLGAMTVENKLDRRALDFLLDAPINGKAVTFHKAFDQSVDLFQTLQQLFDYPVNRVLTSGGCNIMDNLAVLKELVSMGKDKITVLAGGGVKHTNVSAIMAAGVKEIHVGTAVRKSASCLEPIDPVLVGQFLAILNKKGDSGNDCKRIYSQRDRNATA